MGRVTKKNRKNSQLNKILIIVAVGYLFLLGLLFLFNGQLLKNYDENKIKYLNSVENELSQILNKPKEDMTANLEQIVDKYPMELLVYRENELVFQTLPEIKLTEMRDLLNPKALLVEEQGNIDTQNGKMYIWYAVYNMPDSLYIETFFLRQTLLITCLFMVLLVVSVYTQYVLVMPVKKLKNSLDKAKKYQFDEIIDDDDILNKQFYQFTHKMKNAITTVSKNYTQLERELQAEQNRIHNVLIVIRALIHDLKTPIHQQLLENELLIVNDEQLIDNVKMLKKYNVEQAELELHLINDVLRIMDEDVYNLDLNKEKFDLIDLLIEIKKLFRTTIDQKKIFLNIDIPEHVEVITNIVTMKLLLHNIFSNALQYALVGSEICVDVMTSFDSATIQIENTSTLEEIERMKKSEDLFWHLEEKSNQKHKFSSGNGLYLIRELTELLGGRYELKINNTQVIIKITVYWGEDKYAI